jgi:hypothetical protein
MGRYIVKGIGYGVLRQGCCFSPFFGGALPGLSTSDRSLHTHLDFFRFETSTHPLWVRVGLAEGQRSAVSGRWGLTVSG